MVVVVVVLRRRAQQKRQTPERCQRQERLPR
jgi:hypothetical protein